MTLEEEIAAVLYWREEDSLLTKLDYFKTKLWYYRAESSNLKQSSRDQMPEHILKVENLIKSRMAEALTSPYEIVRLMAQEIMKESKNPYP
jgi:hypothetical protein